MIKPIAEIIKTGAARQCKKCSASAVMSSGWAFNTATPPQVTSGQTLLQKMQHSKPHKLGLAHLA